MTERRAVDAAVEIQPLLSDVGDTATSARLLHAVDPGSLQSICARAPRTVLPILCPWVGYVNGINRCDECSRLAPDSKFRLRLVDLGPNEIWTYQNLNAKHDPLNYLTLTTEGVIFRLAGVGFFRRRTLRWDAIDQFGIQRAAEPGLSRDKGAGTRWGSALAWRTVLYRKLGRPIWVPSHLPAEHSEVTARRLSSALNSALGLPLRT
jgi:hypothetical protein